MSSRLKARLLGIRWRILHLNKRQVCRRFYKVMRPASLPYISGDGFRRLARHIYDETDRRISGRDIRDGEILFVATDLMQRFFDEVDPQIEASYKLITHNSDLAVDAAMTGSISEKVLFWYAQNSTHLHPRIVPIPIGLENLHHYHAGVPHEFDYMRALKPARKNRIMVSFAIQTNPQERQPAYEQASRAPMADCLSEWLDQQDYMRTLSEYKFVLSPPGNGLDTHRTWEAMYLGVVPIVKDSSAMRYFQGLGLPLWIVTSWDEVVSVDERDLEGKYEDLKRGFDCPALFMDYWRRVILGKETSNLGSEAASARREIQA